MNSSQEVVQSIHQPLDLQNWFILETPFHRSHNNSQSPTFQISSMQFDSDWEETLNDIDELIQSELRCTGPLSEETQPFVETRVEQLSAPKHVWTNDPSKEPSTDHEWSFTGKAFCKFSLIVIWHRPAWDTTLIIGAGLLLQSSTKCKLQATSNTLSYAHADARFFQRPILLSTVLWQSNRAVFASPHWQGSLLLDHCASS